VVSSIIITTLVGMGHARRINNAV